MHQLRASLTKGGCCVYVTKKKTWPVTKTQILSQISNILARAMYPYLTT